MNHLYIYETDITDLAEKDSKIAIWNGHHDKNNCISIPRYLEENGEKIKEKYVKFIHDLGKKNKSNRNISEYLQIEKHYNLWWMSLLTEKSHYKSERIKDCLKLIALEEIILKNNCSKIFLYFFDKSISKSIVSLCKNLKISCVFKKETNEQNNKNKGPRKSILNKIYYKSPYVIQASIYLIKYISIHWNAKKIKKDTFFFKNKKIFFFFLLDAFR